MKFLIDTNVMIPLDPVSESDFRAAPPHAAELLALANAEGHQTYVHPAIAHDIERDSDDQRRKRRTVLLAKYTLLPQPPALAGDLERTLGTTSHGSNDWVDNNLLAALHADAVDYLVTNDERLLKKARRLGLERRAARIQEAIDIIKRLRDAAPEPPPAARSLLAHSLDTEDSIFDGLRADYPDFDCWLAKCRREHRQAWVVETTGSADYAGLCMVKREDTNPLGLTGKVLKVCTFKVAADHYGNRYGELLLKCLFDYLLVNEFDHAYVTVFPKYGELIEFLNAFGFCHRRGDPKTGEAMLVKELRFTEEEKQRLDPFLFHVRFGPWLAAFARAPAFVVPVQPRYHRILFPEMETQQELAPGLVPCGNSIRKAYLSKSNRKGIVRGANVLFYRSTDVKGITVLGIVEDTMSSAEPDEIARFVGKTSVYTYRQIQDLCTTRLLAILFRRVLLLEEPIILGELTGNHVLRGAPQSITQVLEEGKGWLQRKLRL